MNNMQNMRTIIANNPTWYFSNDKTRSAGTELKTFRLADFPTDSAIEAAKDRVNSLKRKFMNVPAYIDAYLQTLN